MKICLPELYLSSSYYGDLGSFFIRFSPRSWDLTGLPLHTRQEISLRHKKVTGVVTLSTSSTFGLVTGFERVWC